MQQEEYVDPRVIRTKEAIRKALVSLIVERNYNKITITDITLRAGLARPTFYLHYATKEDVLKEIYTETLVPLYWEHMQIWKNTRDDNARAGFLESSFLWHQKNKALMTALLRAGQIEFIINNAEMATKVHLENLLELYGVQLEPEMFDLLVQYIAGGYSRILIDWIRSDFPIDPKLIAVTFTHLTRLVYEYVFSMGRMDGISEVKRANESLNDSL